MSKTNIKRNDKAADEAIKQTQLDHIFIFSWLFTLILHGERAAVSIPIAIVLSALSIRAASYKDLKTSIIIQLFSTITGGFSFLVYIINSTK